MHKHVCTTMLLHLMMNFILMKIFVYLCFHEHDNTKLNHFNSISKGINFRVLQFCPLKMNPILEIRKMMIKKLWTLRL
jgi:hypothetical protein